MGLRTCVNIFSIILLLTYSIQAAAQGKGTTGDTLYLTNPSFEDVPMDSRPPSGWNNCGFQGESPPDTQPNPVFRVSNPASDGASYLGMVVRDNDTWESVGQRLSRPMKKGACYAFSIDLCRSNSYFSQSRVKSTTEQVNYVTPVKIRIYAGYSPCDKNYLLGESKEVISYRWLEYNFKFEPIGNYTHIVIEAFYKTPVLFPYNGNVLLDNASHLVEIPCDDNKPDVAANTPKPSPKPDTPSSPKPNTKTPDTNSGTSSTPSVAVAENKKPVSITEVKRSDLKAGLTVQLDKLYFKTDKSELEPGSNETLEQVYRFLREYSDVVVEVGGHTNNNCDSNTCKKLSTERAKTIVNYLTRRGIPSSRLQYKGYGKSYPLITGDSVEASKKNQRVEIKVIGFTNG